MTEGRKRAAAYARRFTLTDEARANHRAGVRRYIVPPEHDDAYRELRAKGVSAPEVARMLDLKPNPRHWRNQQRSKKR